MTNNFKTILVPLDGSKYSKKALLRASEISHAFDSKIILLYVAEKSSVNLLDRKEYLTMLRKFGKKTLDGANKTLSKKGLSAKSFLKEGNIVSEIEKIVKSEKCDLIVVGNKGLGAVTRFLLGSVSNKLAQHSNCSLLIVK
ncbi:Universal stress protein [Marine Group I thaumarchaeote SCGC AAA799-E16]|uniref:Universal stress protein n=4 Tax=Marine Group I TaxID=905826 RepID=A0A087S979_9ARCH|nr:Universal stress protein [Marine Group I thaumarchaeote SCGC AAA799-N04]KER06524.1 Universal stress protein [Marine Group I thaumarchaeote SCGC AAA799-E16]KFM18456.1 Universal stress protein YxiE [Marine Group I thaumarchaeote SCGC RSA3]KFM22283.1 Universal stress protein [Marine Group I thaumarchaeote SCGC AAA799-B03]